ncbi:hypothetical protein I4U23_022217 [Adineta vaga]|nr:hypothetical protein I4U23_022217 [Adineta vaga]
MNFSIAIKQPFEKIHQYFNEERPHWLHPLDRTERKFIKITRSAYVHHFRSLWLADYKPPWFFDTDCDERQILVNAGLMYGAGDYVLVPSLLWLCQIDQARLSNISLYECIQATNGFRFNLWYGRMHPDFMSLPILPKSLDATIILNELKTENHTNINDNIINELDSTNSSTTSSSSVKPLCTFLDLDRHEIDHLKDVETCVKNVHSFFHIPPPDSPKSTLHLHLVAGEEVKLERKHVFFRVPLSTLCNGEQPSFIVDITRWKNEQRSELVELTEKLSNSPRVYGISGCTGSGKSTLAKAISEKYNAELVQQDDFLLPDDQLPKLAENELSILPARWPQRKNIDRSQPAAVNWQKLIDYVQLLKAQQKIRDMLDRVLFIEVHESEKNIIMQRRMARVRPGCSSEVQMGVTEDEYLPYFNFVWNKYQSYGQSCFQAYHLDYKVSIEEALTKLSSWFVDNINQELTKCQIP